jgi:choline dehydrogenase
MNNIQFLPRGKGLGGSHQLNYLLHFTGLKEDFDRWEKLGVRNWSYKNLKYYLNRHDLHANESTNNNDMPKLSITHQSKDSKLTRAFLNAENEMQITFPNVTFNLAKFTSKRGMRYSVFHEYLRRAYKHKNLFIMVKALVEKIEFREKEAVSVVVRTKSDSITRIYAKREIILCAGTINTPKILKLSGVGNRDELKTAGINLLHHLPFVGENLFDHMNLPIFVSINESASITRNKILSVGEIMKYILDGNGVLSTTGVLGTLRLNDHGSKTFQKSFEITIYYVFFII